MKRGGGYYYGKEQKERHAPRKIYVDCKQIATTPEEFIFDAIFPNYFLPQSQGSAIEGNPII